ncbi:MAG TPA: amino acid permease [Desulfotomaculum sp.]|nr:amino acid permease [Desulfotomaculum sp.]
MPSFRVMPVDNLLAKKRDSAGRLRKVLGPLDLTALGIGAIIGTGIFVITGVAAARYAGPGLIISFIAAGLASGLAALVYAELAATVPVAGSAYTFTYISLGELLAWLVGWNLILEYLVAAGAVSIGWSSYLVSLLQSAGINLPLALIASPAARGIFNLPAAFITGLVTVLIISGTRQGAAVNKIIVMVKVAVILLFIFLGFKHINPANWRPFLPFGVAGIFHGAAIIFFAFIGFDAVSTAAEEVKEPQRSLPLGILLSLGVSTLLYILVTIILTGIVNYKALDTASPMAAALSAIGLRWGSALVATGALAGLTSVILVTMYGQSRIFFAMSRDGLLPSFFSRLHPRFQTPLWNNLFIGSGVALIGALLPINIVAELANIGTLSAFFAVSIGLIILRRTRPDLPRPFRLPGYPVTPLLAAGAALYLAVNLPPLTWVRFFIWVILGIIFYFSYGRRHSALGQENAAIKQVKKKPSLLFPAPLRKPADKKTPPLKPDK